MKLHSTVITCIGKILLFHHFTSHALTQQSGGTGATAGSDNSQIPFSPIDSKLSKITIAGGDLQAQSIPLGYASNWPAWVATPDGKTVTRIPIPSNDRNNDDGWVNPLTFEQLWLPIDLPPPQARYAIGVVLKDGVPRYLFPTIETIIATPDGGAWHNRGMNSFPIGKTWLPFGDIPLESLRLSCYRSDLPQEKGEKKASEDTETEKTDDDLSPVLTLTKVDDVMSLLFNVIGNGPDDMGEGFCYLIAPLTSTVPKEVITPGQRVRLFLSNVETMPTSQDPDDDNAWTWNRGECDLSLYNVAAGGESEYLPKAYKPLYDKEQ